VTHRGPFQPRTFCHSVKPPLEPLQKRDKVTGVSPALMVGPHVPGSVPTPCRGAGQTAGPSAGRGWGRGGTEQAPAARRRARLCRHRMLRQTAPWGRAGLRRRPAARARRGAWPGRGSGAGSRAHPPGSASPAAGTPGPGRWGPWLRRGGRGPGGHSARPRPATRCPAGGKWLVGSAAPQRDAGTPAEPAPSTPRRTVPLLRARWHGSRGSRPSWAGDWGGAGRRERRALRSRGHEHGRARFPALGCGLTSRDEPGAPRAEAEELQQPRG